MSIRRVEPEGVWVARVRDQPAQPAYAQVVEVTRPDASRSVHVAGTFGTDAQGRLAGGDGDVAAQVAAALDNIRRSVEAVGGTVADIVRVKWYTTDLDGLVREGPPIIQSFFDGRVPASTMVQVVRFVRPEAVIEVEAYAEIIGR